MYVSRLTAVALVCAGLCVCLPARARAQGTTPAATGALAQGAFTDATFDVKFRKYTPPASALSPFYSWDARMALDVTVRRKGNHALKFLTIVQSVGTENLGAQVSVGGTGYVIGISYVRSFSADVSISAGVSHLSSHLTRDLDRKTNEERASGLPIPHVEDADEYNAVYVRGRRRFTALPFSPELDVVIQPWNFRFNGGRAAYLRPLFVATRWRLWTRGETFVSAETAHEIGRRPWTEVALILQLFARNQGDGRFQVFASASPGSSLRTSPNIGSVRDGIALGVRMVFHSTTE